MSGNHADTKGEIVVNKVHSKIERAFDLCVKEGAHATVETFPNKVILRITTRYSRDPSRRNNGGEYDFWLAVWNDGVKTYARECCSCDFWEPENSATVVGSTAEVQYAIDAARQRGLLRE